MARIDEQKQEVKVSPYADVPLGDLIVELVAASAIPGSESFEEIKAEINRREARIDRHTGDVRSHNFVIGGMKF
jgi:hypothetical protein